MLTRLYIDNFRCFVNFEFKPGRRQLILGANGSGKSSLMEGLLFVRRLVCGESSLQQTGILYQRTVWKWPPRQTWELEASLDDQTYVYRLLLEPSGGPATPIVVSETVQLGGQPIFEFVEGEVHLFNDQFEHKVSYPFDSQRSALATIAAGKDNRQLTRFKGWLRSLVGFRINPFDMTSQAHEDDSGPKPDLSNVASWYRHLVRGDPQQNEALLASLRPVLDGFALLRFDPAGKSSLLMAEFVDALGQSFKFEFDELSEGQRCLICLYAILHFVLAKGATVIIDEPDNFISLREIQPWLMEATESVEDGSGQLILISHHPEILNQWAPECGIRFVRDGIGPVRVQEFRGDRENILTPAEIVARGWENE
jgi:predicted ATPase